MPIREPKITSKEKRPLKGLMTRMAKTKTCLIQAFEISAKNTNKNGELPGSKINVRRSKHPNAHKPTEPKGKVTHARNLRQLLLGSSLLGGSEDRISNICFEQQGQGEEVTDNGDVRWFPPPRCTRSLGRLKPQVELKHHLKGRWEILRCQATPEACKPQEIAPNNGDSNHPALCAT